MTPRPPEPRSRVPVRGRGFTIVEVAVALAIFLFGVVALLNFFPVKIRAGADAALLTEAVFLAQLKAQEVRRDNDPADSFYDWMRSLTSPEPVDGIAFAQNPNLRYAFSGRSVIDPFDEAAVPEDDFGVPRIIVISPTHASRANGVIYELRFDN